MVQFDCRWRDSGTGTRIYTFAHCFSSYSPNLWSSKWKLACSNFSLGTVISAIKTMSSYITPELLSFAVKCSGLQWWYNLPRNYSQNTSPSQGSLSRGRRVAKHTCALSMETPLLQVFSAWRLGAESTGLLSQNCDSICERFIETWGALSTITALFCVKRVGN